MTDRDTETYKNLNDKSWTELLRRNTYRWNPPATVHLPIHPAHAPDFVHVDAALNVCRRRVPPNLSTRDVKSAELIRGLESLLVQFAFDDPPFVPDFNLSELSLAEGRYPVVTGSYYAWDLLYEIQYYCTQSEDGRTILWCEVSVQNDDPQPRDAVVWAKVNIQKEETVFDYHYIPFNWDARNWLPCDRIALREGIIDIDGRPAGRVRPGAFTCQWRDRESFKDEDCNKRFLWEQPYFVHPPFRLRNVDDLMRFQVQLNPGERQAFTVALAVDFERCDEDLLRQIVGTDADTARITALHQFKAMQGPDMSKLTCPVDRLDDMFSALQIGIHQLTIDFKQGNGLMPTQGGSSERFYIWIWEALAMLSPMLKLGHFDLVRNALEMIFSLQDSGFPPEGELTSLEGAVGTTGPRWLNSTGSALSLAADHYLYSRDPAFLEQFLPKMMRAADWIIREIRASRRMNPDGSRPATYGIMPFGCATDGDIGHILSMSDAYSFLGLGKLVDVLEAINDPRTPDYRAELNLYQADLSRAIDSIVREDGFMDRKILTGKEKQIQRKFENITGAVSYVYTGIVDVSEPRWKHFVDYYENNLADHYFTGPMDREVEYIGASEHLWQDAWLRAGEWKKAFMAWQTNRQYGMTQDTFQVQERFSKRNRAFTCWQPNGSGSGRMLDMVIKSLWFEYPDPVRGQVTVVLGGMPWAYLQENRTTKLDRLHLADGNTLSLAVQPAEKGVLRLTLTFDHAQTCKRTLRFPSFLDVQTKDGCVSPLENGYFRLASDCVRTTFRLMENNV